MDEDDGGAYGSFTTWGASSEDSSPRAQVVEPGPSCLKRPHEGGGGADSSSKRAKKQGVQWADHVGGELRNTLLFECDVDKFKKSTTEYHEKRKPTHKDLVKRERQLEKDAHMSQLRDSMQPTVPWSKPALLDLPSEIAENIASPVNSAEVEEQTSRLKRMLEARYVSPVTRLK